MHMGARLAFIRKSRSLTQGCIAQKLGKTPQWLSNIERGVRPIGAEELGKIARLLQVQPGLFFATNFNEMWIKSAPTGKPPHNKGGEKYAHQTPGNQKLPRHQGI